MAEVTVAAGYPLRVVNGNMNEWIYQFNIAADADTLTTPLGSIKAVNMNDSAISAIGVASVSGGVITWNVGGALTGVYCRVIGW